MRCCCCWAAGLSRQVLCDRLPCACLPQEERRTLPQWPDRLHGHLDHGDSDLVGGSRCAMLPDCTPLLRSRCGCAAASSTALVSKAEFGPLLLARQRSLN